MPLLTDEAEVESLISAIKNGIVDEVELAFKNDIYFQHTIYHLIWKCEEGICMTVLNCAVYYGKVSLVTYLLTLLERTKNGKIIRTGDLATSLHLAAEGGHTTIVKLLLKYGANIEWKDEDGDTPLLIAVQANHEDIVNILIEAGANVNATNILHKSSLHAACLKGFLSIVKLLLDAGAYINMPDAVGQTPLFHASINNKDDVIKLLLDRGADATTITNMSRKTALHIYVKRGNVDVIELLLKNGTDVHMHRNNSGEDIFDLAKFRGDDFSKSLITLILYLNINTTKPEGHDSDDISNIWDSCKSELELMETCKIAESNISYRQLLLESDQSKLAAYLSNADIVSELDMLVYKKKFPIYKEYITKNIRKGDFRLQLYYTGDKVLNQISPFLPSAVREKILNYLSNDDIENLINSNQHK